jgi:hypothetical protein
VLIIIKDCIGRGKMRGTKSTGSPSSTQACAGKGCENTGICT